MNARVKRVGGFVLRVGLGSWLGTGVVLWWVQERLIFPAPAPLAPAELRALAAGAGAEELALVAEDGVPLYGWRLRSPEDHHRAVLFFHGNGEAVVYDGPIFTFLQDAGWDVVAVEYRGYPGSGGAPTEAGLAADARAACAWATGPGGYAPPRIVVYGRSLGGGVAAGLVAGPAAPAALVLESTFASLRGVAAHRLPVYPMGLLLRHPFDTDRVAGRLDLPVLLTHSVDDRVIPIALGGRALAPLVPGVEYHETSGWGHDDPFPLVDPELRATFLAFLARAVPG